MIKFIILGCGSSMGVPRADGNWGRCDSKNIKNFRTRCSAFIKSTNKNILIDTSPDLRFQLIKNKIKDVDLVLYSHMHGDQVHGINDLRIFSLMKSKKIPVYADNLTKKYLLKNFTYCFKNTRDYRSILTMNNMQKNFSIKDGKNKISIKSIPVQHGLIKSQSFIINNACAYISDANKIYSKDIKHFKRLKYLVIDCLRLNKHPSHFNLDDVLKLQTTLKAKNVILTNLHSDLDYKRLKSILPKNIKPAHDGLSFNF